MINWTIPKRGVEDEVRNRRIPWNYLAEIFDGVNFLPFQIQSPPGLRLSARALQDSDAARGLAASMAYSATKADAVSPMSRIALPTNSIIAVTRCVVRVAAALRFSSVLD